MNLLKDDIKKLYLRYFFPTVSGALVTSIYILFDTIFIGQGVGGDGLAALNIVLPIYSLVFGIGYLLGIGGSTVLGIERGRNNEKKAIKIFSLSVISSIIISILLGVILKVFLRPISYFLGATDLTMELIIKYMNVVICAIPSFMIGATLQGFIRVDKAPKRAMVATITGGLINIVLDYIFVFPMNMGMFGAALATGLSYTLSALILCTHFLSKSNTLKIDFNCFKFDYFRRIIKNGIPSLFVEISSGVVIFLFNLQLLRLIGEVGITAYSIISNTALIIVSIMNGVCQTIQPIVSVNFGAKEYKRTAELKKVALVTALIIGAISAFIGFLFPDVLISVFVKPTDEIRMIATRAIYIYFTAFFLMGANMVISGYFQAIERSRMAIFISVLRGLILVSIFIFILPIIFGVDGIWFSVPLAELLVFIFAMTTSVRMLNKIV